MALCLEPEAKMKKKKFLHLPQDFISVNGTGPQSIAVPADTGLFMRKA